jgi:uncharacterized membrane protein YraQ (UPF0718 family)
MDTFNRFLSELWHILLELSPWLLFGLLLAGLLHVLLPTGFIRRHLGGSRFGNVFKAVAVGVPMPLCSCGVIPTAIGLKKDGASDGAATGFLISTPQTGVDSILVSATFLGWPFAIFKVISALLSGLIGGLLVNAINRNNTNPPPPSDEGHSTIKPPVATGGSCCATDSSATAVSAVPNSNIPPTENSRRWREIVTFGLVDLLRDIYRWLIVGVLIAALISTFIPEGKLASVSWAHGIWGMFAMLIISLPMYICATASVPLAASLVVAGMSPGAALVFLMAGPTTNVATMGAILKSFGKSVLAIYLTTVIVMSISLGLLFDWLLKTPPAGKSHIHPLPIWLEVAAAVVLIIFLAWFAGDDLAQRLRPKKSPPCCASKS